MIHRVYSSLPTFKNLVFHSGLNVLLAQKEAGSSVKQTRNRAGKTSLIEIVHFLTGANADKASLFRTEALINETFGMEFDLDGERVIVERTGNEPSKIQFQGKTITNSEWSELLGEKIFGLKSSSQGGPTWRSLLSYFVRRQESGAFTVPEKQATLQQPGDFQQALLFLLGMDWQIAEDWQKVRVREKSLTELKKIAAEGSLRAFAVGKSADLRTQLALAESRQKDLQAQLSAFRVLPQYADLEKEADLLTRKINTLANESVTDVGMIRDLERALESEAPPPLVELESVYAEAGVALPGLALRRYDEVRNFHESVVRNRRNYLTEELDAARGRISSRGTQLATLDSRRSEVMALLSNHGALEHFSNLQQKSGRMSADVESLRQRFEAAVLLEGTKNELEIERKKLELRLRRELSEQSALVDKAILAFEETSKGLYESAGRMTISATPNGPEFDFPIQGFRSKGIKTMRIFCFDLMLMRLCTGRHIGPGFLIHDSHLFDGVDGRQVVSALKVAAEAAEDLWFQYIVTMNEDDAFKEKVDGFDVSDHVLPVRLTDASDDGGLFGIRF